jgi:hypothetical protein
MKIKGFEYTVTELGVVFSTRSCKIITPYIANGYYKVDLYDNLKRRKVYVHQLVGECYHKDTWFAGAVINHKDGNRLNNHKDNLEWSTYSRNNKHAYEVLGRICPTRAKGSASVHAVKIIQVDRVTGKIVMKYGSIKEAQDKFGSGVEKCLSGKRKTAYGFKWKYK